MRRAWAVGLVGLVAMVLVVASASPATKKPPRIVSAVMLDADRDARADRLRLTYLMRIRHTADRDGRYPFTVAGYRIRSVGAATGRSLVILVVEKARPDSRARPVIRYLRTSSKPVTGPAGTQAAAQLFRRVRAHRKAPLQTTSTPTAAPTTTATTTVKTTTTTTTTTTTSTTGADADRDGYPDARDCAPRDAKVHPGAPDLPDLAFVDSNCDEIDGTETDAIFASPKGSDTNPGTKAKPKRQIQAAVTAASLTGRYVLAAAGSYSAVVVTTELGVYGGYDQDSWRRASSSVTSISGAPQGLTADGVAGAEGLTLQLLSVSGTNAGATERSAYGIRAINGSKLKLQRVTVTAGGGAAGLAGVPGARGTDGQRGGDGTKGACDAYGILLNSNYAPPGGPGGASSVGRAGGRGGNGGHPKGYGATSGQPGSDGQVGTPGGAGGKSGDPGKAGSNGQDGVNGARGANGAGGPSSTAAAAPAWVGPTGASGGNGTAGTGGGGGGGGGAQTGLFVLDGAGNGGGGGGAGGSGGRGGAGGHFGGGSFAIYLYNSTLVADSSSFTAGPGGVGGHGGDGGAPGGGAFGGAGARECTSQIGRGGNGGTSGAGGPGGAGGGGAGGPSIGVMKAGTSTATVKDTQVAIGSPGAGGAAGTAGFGAGAPGLAQRIFPAS
jgi:hypothetical protein